MFRKECGYGETGSVGQVATKWMPGDNRVRRMVPLRVASKRVTATCMSLIDVFQ